MTKRTTRKPGDVVQLKSGGPYMTVRDAGSRIACIWFDYQCGVHTDSFPADCLQTAPEVPPLPRFVSLKKARRRSARTKG